MTPQQAFDKAYIGVVRQGKPAQNDKHSCAYRGEDGTACGVGHLLTDKQAARLDNLADGSISSIFYRNPNLLPKWMLEYEGFLFYIQRAHDNAVVAIQCKGLDFITTFKENMKAVAEKFGLTIPEVKEGA